MLAEIQSFAQMLTPSNVNPSYVISKALTFFEPDLRRVLKTRGFLTRDSRVVERKKYGKAKARRSFQFSKR